MREITKTCPECSKHFTASGKGSTKARYCLPCRAIVRQKYAKKYEEFRNNKRLEKKGYIIPDESLLTFYGYKEPLSKFTDGFGYVGTVAYSKEKDKVQCHLCGRMFRNVGSHAALKHKISAEAYKDKVGLPQNAALVGEDTRELLIKAHADTPSFSQVGKTPEEIREHMVKMSNKGVKRGKGKKRSGWSMERRNKTGNCPEQVISKIKILEQKLGRRPGAEEYQKEYGSISPIITIYGTWNKAVELAGLTTYTEEKEIRSDPSYLIEQMVHFYEKYGRSPKTSDGKRGLIPHHQIYHSVFGSLNNARILAGIPAVIQISKFRYDEVILTPEERINYIKNNGIEHLLSTK